MLCHWNHYENTESNACQHSCWYTHSWIVISATTAKHHIQQIVEYFLKINHETHRHRHTWTNAAADLTIPFFLTILWQILPFWKSCIFCHFCHFMAENPKWQKMKFKVWWLCKKPFWNSPKNRAEGTKEIYGIFLLLSVIFCLFCHFAKPNLPFWKRKKKYGSDSCKTGPSVVMVGSGFEPEGRFSQEAGFLND